MSIKALRKFGKLRSVFRGTGSIKLNDGSDIRARFTLGQLVNTQLLVCADIGHSPGDFLSNDLQIESLQGRLTDGRTISVTSLFVKENKFVSGTHKTQLVAYSGHWTISGQSLDGQTSISFELVNFCYLGTESETTVIDGTKYGKLSLMTLFLEDKQVQLRWVADYEQAEAALKAQRGIQVTCTATTTIGALSEVDTIILMMDTLCDVMSVARGTLVSWTSFDVTAGQDVPLYSRYRNSVTRRYAGIELIDSNDRINTKHFLEEGYRKCGQLDKEFQVRRIARAFTETRDGPFVESRSLLIAVLAEYLASVRARLEDRTYFLDNGVFTDGWEAFKDKAKATLKETYPNIKNKHLPAMLGNMKGLNRRPLSWKLNILAKWLAIEFDQGEIDDFVRTRNQLAHEGKFPEKNAPIVHYQKMQHFLDRIVLRLFGYHGPYYDFEHREMRQI